MKSYKHNLHRVGISIHTIEHTVSEKDVYCNCIWHRINGPAYISYKRIGGEEIDFVEYWIYDKRFLPWWIK